VRSLWITDIYNRTAAALGSEGVPRIHNTKAGSCQRVLTASLILANLSSCASVSRTDRAELNHVSFRVVEDSVRLRRSSKFIAFDVHAIVRNDTRRTLLVGAYNIAAQRQIDSAWQTVWVNNCVGCPGYQSIPAGGSITIPVRVLASLTPDTDPRADPRLTHGRYRLLLEVAFGQDTSSQRIRMVPGPPLKLEFHDFRPSSVFELIDSLH
jgi:hypothetical protein